MSQKHAPANDNGFALFTENFTFSGWKNFLSQVLKNIHRDNVVIVSGGVAFFFFLALFPAIAGIISIYGLVSNPEQIQEQLGFLASMLPVEAQEFINNRLKKLISGIGNAQGWQLASSILLSIWVANIGTRALFKGVSIAYNTEYKRNFLNENKMTLLFTVGGIFFNILMIVLLVGLPAVAKEFGFKEMYDTLLRWLQGPVLAIIIAGALSLVYSFAPYGRSSKLKKTIPGAVVAGILWVIGSWGLSLMLRTVGIFSQPYGSSLAIVFLMLWCLLISFIIILGAEINALIRDNGEEKSGDDD